MGREKSVRVGVVRRGGGFVLRYTDPVTGRPAERKAAATRRREAEREAGDLEQMLASGRTPAGAVTWAAARERYEVDHLAGLAPATQSAWSTAASRFEGACSPAKVADVDALMLLGFVRQLREQGRAATTIATYVRTIRAMLSWCRRIPRWIEDVPEVDLPRDRGRRARSRPPTPAEFEALLAAVPTIRPVDPEPWRHLLRGLWLSGLRLGEAAALSWDSGPMQISTVGRYPKYLIQAAGEKGRRDRTLPLTPDAAEFFLAEPDQTGRVFDIDLTVRRIGRTISEIGTASGVITNSDTGKFCTAHDLRRAFGSRWAPRVKPAVLQALMRHRNIDTTMKFYVELDADDLADALWRDFGGDKG